MGYYKNLQVPHYRQTRQRVDTAGNPQVGTHAALISDVAKRESRAGDPMLVFEYEIAEGPDQGKRARQFHMLDELYGQEALLKTLDRLGVACDGDGNFDGASLVGMPVTVEVVASKKDPHMVNVKTAWRSTTPAEVPDDDCR